MCVANKPDTEALHRLSGTKVSKLPGYVIPQYGAGTNDNYIVPSYGRRRTWICTRRLA